MERCSSEVPKSEVILLLAADIIIMSVTLACSKGWLVSEGDIERNG